MRLVVFVLMGLLCAATARAALQTEVIEYRHVDMVLERYLAYDDSVTDKRPRASKLWSIRAR